MGAGEAAASGESLDAGAYRRLYPEDFFERFAAEGVRPSGRPLAAARPASIGLGAVPTADGSALAKIGNTAMLAGVKLEAGAPPADAPDRGSLVVGFEMPPLCTPAARPGRPPDAAPAVVEQLARALAGAKAVDLRELCIAPGRAAWTAYVDVYCLDADGALLDTALLAATAALADLELPEVSVDEDGRVVPAHRSRGGATAVDGAPPRRRLTLGEAPAALTLGVFRGRLVADPSAEESAVMDATVTVALGCSGRLLSVYKLGGAADLNTAVFKECIEMACSRAAELRTVLQDTVAEVVTAKDVDMLTA
eukprot:SM000015S01296  [mRNA]  locus=s15:1157145:1158859:+ [translate_table: standard]